LEEVEKSREIKVDAIEVGVKWRVYVENGWRLVLK
jgi:hypothetical protein